MLVVEVGSKDRTRRLLGEFLGICLRSLYLEKDQMNRNLFYKSERPVSVQKLHF